MFTTAAFLPSTKYWILHVFFCLKAFHSGWWVWTCCCQLSVLHCCDIDLRFVISVGCRASAMRVSGCCWTFWKGCSSRNSKFMHSFMCILIQTPIYVTKIVYSESCINVCTVPHYCLVSLGRRSLTKRINIKLSSVSKPSWTIR